MKLFRLGGVMLAVAVMFLAAISHSASVDATEGGGNSSGGVLTNCTFPHAYAGLCNDNGKTIGGKSWHIYRMSDSGPKQLSGIMDTEIKTKDILTVCSGKEWYITFGWDGRANGVGSDYAHYGPLKYEQPSTQRIKRFSYNDYLSPLTVDQIKVFIQKGSLNGINFTWSGNLTPGYGRQLQEQAAIELYKYYAYSAEGKKVSSIPNGTGYFCFSDSMISNSFQGVSTVRKGTSDWNSTPDNQKTSTGLMPEGGDSNNRSVALEVNGCDDGCEVTMSHALVRRSGSGSTYYRLRKWSNVGFAKWEWIDDAGNVIQSESLREKRFTQNGVQQPVFEKKFVGDSKMYTGQRECEEMVFSLKGEKQGLLGTTVCALATGSIKTELDVKVKNKNGALEANSNYSDSVFAKPGDEVEFLATYNPKVQKTVNFVPGKLKIDGEIKSDNNNSKLKDAYNNNNGNEKDWNNAFTIKSEGFLRTVTDGIHEYEVGDTDEKKEPDIHTVASNEVGKELKETASINDNDNVKTTPKQVTFAKEGDNMMVANVDTGPLDATASVKVPYNFKNSVEMSNDNINDYAFAGETFSTSYNITTAPRYNGLVGGDAYATIVKGAKWKAGVCTDKNNIDTCSWYEEKEGDLNTSNKLEGSSEGRSTSVITPDLPAGAEIYVRAAVYPAESSDDNWQDPGGNHGWAYSNPVTVKVAKKPSFQVWGGDIHVGGQVSVPIANKSKLDGYNDETLCNGKVWVFGSWGELAVVAKDPGNLASGAVLGYTENDNGDLKANPGGGDENKLKDSLGNLTFRGGVGELSSESIENLAKMLEDRVTKVNPNDAVENTGTIGGLDNVGESKLYKNESEINITGNILYKDGPYNTLESIPKVIIYANNINIDCKVKRIDAILIAKGNINTCPDRDGKNAERSAENSNELRINGAVIAGGTLILNRTYGAATGDKSIVPAETINMDPSWYLWAADIIPEITNETNEPTNDILVPTYMRELPPRY